LRSLIYPALLLLLGSYSTRARWWLLLIFVKAHHTDYSSSSSKLPSFLLCHADADLLDSFACAERFFFLSLSRVRLFYRVSRLVYLPIDYKAARPGSRKKKNCYRYTRKDRGRIYSNQQIGNRIPSRFRERAHSADDDDSTQSAGKEKKKKSSSSSYIYLRDMQTKKNIFFCCFRHFV
jgi:hypothetical protein